MCLVRKDAEEDSLHIFNGCLPINILWMEIAKWCNLPPIYAFSVGDLLKFHEGIPGPKSKKIIVQAIMLISCWIIWKSRNKMVFNKRRVSVEEMVRDVKAFSLLWIKNRAPAKLEIEKNWVEFDFGI